LGLRELINAKAERKAAWRQGRLPEVDFTQCRIAEVRLGSGIQYC